MKLQDLLSEKCWKGYEKKGTKKMFGKTYPNCVKKQKSEGKVEEKKFIPTITIDFTRENRGKGKEVVKKFKSIEDAKKYKLKRQKGFWGNPVTGIELSQNFS